MDLIQERWRIITQSSHKVKFCGAYRVARGLNLCYNMRKARRAEARPARGSLQGISKGICGHGKFPIPQKGVGNYDSREIHSLH